MTKVEFVNKYAEKYECSKKDAVVIVDNMINTVMEVVSSGEKINITGFGVMEVKERKERKGINPTTKEPMTIPASKVIRFKAGSEFKKRCNS